MFFAPGPPCRFFFLWTLGVYFGAMPPGLFCSSFTFSKIPTFPFDALGPRGGPHFLTSRKWAKTGQRGLRPLWDSPCGRAGAAFGRNSREGTAELLAPSALELPRRFAWALPAKAATDVVPCAGAHDRQTFPFGEPGGPGGEAPTPKRWRCGNRGERVCVRAFPNGTEAPAAKRRGVRSKRARQRGLGGFQRGASSTPLWSGDPQGGETPLRLSLPTFCRGRK